MASKPQGRPQGNLPVSFFHKLASSVPGVLFTYWLSPDQQTHHYPYVSDQVRALFGAEPSALNDNADVVFRIIHPDDAAGVENSIRESARTLTPWCYRARLRVASGDYQWFESHSMPEQPPDGSILWYGQLHSIQHYKELEQNLRDSEAEFQFQGGGVQKLIARLSTEFINLGFGTIDECIDELLSSISNFFGVDRAYVYAFSEDYSLMTNTHEWCSPGVCSLIESQQQLPIDQFWWWHEQILAMVDHNKVVFIENVDSLPADASHERAML